MTEDRPRVEPIAPHRDMWRPALLLLALLLVARCLAIYSIYFYEEDEIALAAGVAALLRGNVGDLYRYTPQLGYYRLVEGIGWALGGHVAYIPGIMKALSALAGALIPALALFAFSSDFSVRERALAALSVAINPIIWKSSQYGNTAIVATALASAGLVILSNRHTRPARVAALALIGSATLVRGDAVFFGPVVGLLLYRHDGRLADAVKWSGAFALTMVAVYGATWAIDPKIDSATAAVIRHLSVAGETQFWEYLLWAMSPIPLIFAAAGIPSLLASRPGILAALAVWCLPVMLFYFPATTTPRYFLNCALPVSLAGAVAIEEIAGRLRRWLGSPLAWAAVGALASVHLVVALGQFSSASPPWRGAFIITDDRAMPTGALLYTTYFDRNTLLWSRPRSQSSFGEGSPYWEPAAFSKALDILAAPASPKRTVVIVLDGGWPHAFHYHAQAAGARYVSRAPGDPSFPFASETWLEIGNSRIMTINREPMFYDHVPRFNVQPGDQIWLLDDAPTPDEATVRKLPPGLSLEAVASFHQKVRVYRVVQRD